MLVELDGVRPTIGRNVFIAPTAVLIGDVRVGDRANIWFGAVLRGDFSYIEIGEGSSIQDNSVVHCAGDLPTVVGRDVIVGHGSILEGCVVEDGALTHSVSADTVRMRRMPRRYSGDMCSSPSTSLPAARCSRTSSSVRWASWSISVSTYDT